MRAKTTTLRVVLVGLASVGAALGWAQVRRAIASGADAERLSLLYVVEDFRPRDKLRDPEVLAYAPTTRDTYVADTGNKRIGILNYQGVYVRDLEVGEIEPPVGIAVDAKDRIYVTQFRRDQLLIIDQRKRSTSTLDMAAAKERYPVDPGRLSADGRGRLYVVDRGNWQVLVYDTETLELEFRFGSSGEREGQFRKIEDVAVDRNGRIYVLDSEGLFPIQVFDSRGRFLDRLTRSGQREDELNYPVAIAVDDNDQIWVVDQQAHSVKVFDRFGSLLLRIGERGQAPSQFLFPSDIALDPRGRFYVLEKTGRRVQAFEIDDFRRRFRAF